MGRGPLRGAEKRPPKGGGRRQQGMKKRLAKDYGRRRAVDAHWQRRRALKAVAHDQRRPAATREAAQVQLTARPRQESRTRVRALCTDTGYARSVRTWFRRSRFRVRERAHRGAIPGLRKASW